MATPKPNHQKLVVTGKSKTPPKATPPEYTTDMRDIEMWANEGIVRKINSGTGVTTDPTDGVDQGQGITINASGGGGGSTPGVLLLNAGPDVNDQTVVQILGPSEVIDSSLFTSRWPLNSTGATDYTINISTSWFVFGNPGDSMCIFPFIQAPAFTPFIDPNIIVSDIFISASSLDFVNQGTWQDISSYGLTSGGMIQPPAADFAALFGGPSGVDLSLVAGTGDTGNGIVTTAGTIPYLANTTMRITVLAGTTFT